MNVMFESACPDLPLLNRGKVRDIYGLKEHLLLVATDRLSALDVVSEQPIPEKGRVLTEMSAFWFGWLKTGMPWLNTHFVTTDWAEIAQAHPEVCPYEDQLAGRSTLVLKMDRILGVEGIGRNYLYGSSWRDYQKTGMVSGIQMTPGMLQAEELWAAQFTPSTKAGLGEHDENISVAQAIELSLVTGIEVSAVAGITVLVLTSANTKTKKNGIIVADTKFEFGVLDGKLYLADEVLTPDSSRFWPMDEYKPGQEQPSLDKEPVRSYLLKLIADKQWDGKAPMPKLPDDVVSATTQRYLKALMMLCN